MKETAYYRISNYETLMKRAMGRKETRKDYIGKNEYAGLCYSEEGHRCGYSHDKICDKLIRAFIKISLHSKIDKETQQEIQVLAQKINMCYCSNDFDVLIKAVIDLTTPYKEFL